MSYSNADIALAREYFPRGLAQPEQSFRFSMDALLLAAYAARLRPGWRRLADLGCGVGPVAFGLLLLDGAAGGSNTDRTALGLELQDELLEAARLNAARLGFESVFKAERADFMSYAPGGAAGTFDLVTANPPYRRIGEGRLPPSALRRAALFGGAELLASFVRAGRSLLAEGGVFCLVFPFRRLGELEALLASEGLSVFDALPVQARAEGEPGLVLAAARAEGGEYKARGGQVQNPLILYEGASGGRERLTGEALSFCRFLACNDK